MKKFIKVPNPAYAEEMMEEIRYRVEQSGYPVQNFFPEEYGKALPEDGAWIILLTEVRVGRKVNDQKTLHIVVPHLSMWFATPTAIDGGEVGIPKKQAVIQTPDGAVHIWPHEYNIVEDISVYLDYIGHSLTLHYLTPSSNFDPEKLHYMMSRGIARTTAQKWLLPELKDPFFCYFTTAPEIGEALGDGYGMTVLTDTNRRRRAEARKQRTERTKKRRTKT